MDLPDDCQHCQRRISAGLNTGSPASAGALMGSPPSPGASGGALRWVEGAHCARLRSGGVLKGLAGAWRGWAGGLPPALDGGWPELWAPPRGLRADPAQLRSRASTGLGSRLQRAWPAPPRCLGSPVLPQTSLLWDEFLFFWK